MDINPLPFALLSAVKVILPGVGGTGGSSSQPPQPPPPPPAIPGAPVAVTFPIKVILPPAAKETTFATTVPAVCVIFPPRAVMVKLFTFEMVQKLIFPVPVVAEDPERMVRLFPPPLTEVPICWLKLPPPELSLSAVNVTLVVSVIFPITLRSPVSEMLAPIVPLISAAPSILSIYTSPPVAPPSSVPVLPNV